MTKTKQDWESIFSMWSKSPGKMEQERCERAKRAIENAIKSDMTLSMKLVETFVQGSYHNRTNVRQNSDVDVCVLYSDAFFCDLPEGVTPQQVGIEPTNYKFRNYKNNVKRALVNKFGRNSVNRGNKAFNIKENSNRIDADAVPCFEYRQYYYNGRGYFSYHRGTVLIADDTGFLATNFPQQQYKNGIERNKITNKRFKKAVRIIKKLSHEMEDNNYTSAKNISSFLIENLVWNADISCFNSQSLHSMTQDILLHLWKCTEEDATCKSWTEENGIKFLFHPKQKWTRTQAHQFLQDAWTYIVN